MDTNQENKSSEQSWGFPEKHLLQTTEWGAFKSQFGWEAESISSSGGTALVLFRRLPLGFTLGYIPKGPFGRWLPDMLPELDAVCRTRRAIALKVEPDIEDNTKVRTALLKHGFRPSPQTVQPQRTLLIDLRGTEEDILARMNQKTRYNIRLARRKDVVVEAWSDIAGFAGMMDETSHRNRFGVHTLSYYQQAYDIFSPGGSCQLFMASYEKQPLAAIMVFKYGRRAWYFYGASTSLQRNRMPTYLLQWEAIRWAKENGCVEYDLWGIPDYDLDTLEAEFSSRSDGLWGVYRFKRGFGGRLSRSVGAWDRPYNPLYSLYQLVMKRRSAGSP